MIIGSSTVWNTIRLQEMRIGIARQVPCPGGPSGIPQIHDIESEIPLKPGNIGIAAVQDFEDPRIRERGLESFVDESRRQHEDVQ